MISYHPDTRNLFTASHYSRGFRVAEVHDLHRIARCMSRHVWSYCIWEEGRRKQEKFLCADHLGLDIDGTLPLKQALRALCDVPCVVGITRNHQVAKTSPAGAVTPPCDRYRILIRLNRRITDLKTMRATARFYINKWDADGQCKDGARLFFPCREIVTVNTEGDAWEVIEPDADAPDEFVPAAVEDGELTAFALRFLRSPLPLNEKNDYCHRFAKDLVRAGFSVEQIFSMIRTSPEYGSLPMSNDLAEEIRDAIRSAERAIKEEHRGQKG